MTTLTTPLHLSSTARRTQAVLMLMGIAAVWGFTPPMIKEATDGFPVGSVALTVPQPSTLWAVLYLGIVCIAIATVAQTWAQRSVTANETALIFCTEPAWGALAGVLLAGEQFTGLGLLGCALMLLGMAWPELQAVMTRASRAQLLTKGCAKGGK